MAFEVSRIAFGGLLVATLLVLSHGAIVPNHPTKDDAAVKVIKLRAADDEGAGQQSTMPVPPENTHAILGGTVRLVCEVNVLPPTSRVNWYEYVTTGIGQMISDNQNLLPSHPNFGRYRLIQDTPFQFHLEISNVQYGDAGMYMCMNSQAGPPNKYRGTAEVIVIASQLVCSTPVPANGIVIDQQQYTAQCALDYRGKFNPHMVWSGHPGLASAISVSDTTVTSGVLFTVERDMDGLSFRVDVFFQPLPTQPDDVADNTPTYTNEFVLQTLSVQWGPVTIDAAPRKDNYEVGDTIICNADSNPSPVYTWQNLVSLEITYGQIFVVTAGMVGLNHSMRCQAQNVIQGFVFSNNTFVAVNVPAPTTTPPTTTPTTTTPPPAEANCDELSGWWVSLFPPAELFMQSTADLSGKMVGFMRNGSDQQWVEAVGRTRLQDNAYLGLSVIWPYQIGVTGMAAECHKCYGEEVIMTSGIWRSSMDSMACGDGGSPSPHTTYVFYRVPNKVGRYPPSLADRLKMMQK